MTLYDAIKANGPGFYFYEEYENNVVIRIFSAETLDKYSKQRFKIADPKELGYIEKEDDHISCWAPIENKLWLKHVELVGFFPAQGSYKCPRCEQAMESAKNHLAAFQARAAEREIARESFP